MPSKTNHSARVVGLGGVFFRAQNPVKLSEWYRRRLGLRVKQNVTLFTWRTPKGSNKLGYTVWALFPADTPYFRNSRKQFMINYRVKDLDKVLAKLRRERVKIAKKIEESEYGRFAWVSDPEGNWLELWEPPKKYGAPEEEMPME